MSQATVDQDLEVTPATPQMRREQAVRRIKKRKDFQGHLVAYLVINGFLWALWAVIGATSGSWVFPWPVFVTLGWGIGLLMNAWEVYFRRPISEADIRREMDRLSGGTA